jgi:hypothetical protein
MGAPELQSNWPEMRKTLGKPLVFERRGQEPNFLMFFQCFFENSKGAKSVTLASRHITSSKD